VHEDLFLPSHRCLTPPSGGTPCNINIFNTSLKSTFSGLQFYRTHYGSVFIRLAVVAFQDREIMRNSDKIWPHSSSRSSKVINLDSVESPGATSCQSLIVTLAVIWYRFRDTDV